MTVSPELLRELDNTLIQIHALLLETEAMVGTIKQQMNEPVVPLTEAIDRLWSVRHDRADGFGAVA